MEQISEYPGYYYSREKRRQTHTEASEYRYCTVEQRIPPQSSQNADENTYYHGYRHGYHGQYHGIWQCLRYNAADVEPVPLVRLAQIRPFEYEAVLAEIQ